jgi:hypothetical protein
VQEESGSDRLRHTVNRVVLHSRENFPALINCNNRVPVFGEFKYPVLSQKLPLCLMLAVCRKLPKKKGIQNGEG